jgi:hypothetical protein
LSAVRHHADQLIILSNGNGTDIMTTHQFCQLGHRRIWTNPINALVHRVFDFHGHLFSAGIKKKSTVRIHRFRRRPGAHWEKILNPTEGVTLKTSSVLVARTEAERFEREHALFGHHAAGNDQHSAKAIEAPVGQSGAPARYDWNAFAGAVARRVHDEGMPASQGELVRDMLDWFAASGAVPDESTVRRRVQALWAVLKKKKAG